MPLALASPSPGRSTTATSGGGPPATGRRPVSSSTWASATAAASCSSRTTAAASSRVVSGPALISRRAVRPARSQSTIEEALLIASRYAAPAPAAVQRQPQRGQRCATSSSAPSAALAARPVGDDGEREQPAVAGDDGAGAERVHAEQRAGLGTGVGSPALRTPYPFCNTTLPSLTMAMAIPGTWYVCIERATKESRSAGGAFLAYAG